MEFAVEPTKSSPPSWRSASVAAAAVLAERSSATVVPSRWSAGILALRVSFSRRPSWPAWPAGVDVVRLGVLPTPGVAFLTGATFADLGVMISASHNPMPDNGIKFFARGGAKLGDELEDAIEARMTAATRNGANPRPTGSDVGRVRDDPALVEHYIAHLVSSLGGGPVSLEASKSSSTAPTARPMSPLRRPSRPRRRCDPDPCHAGRHQYQRQLWFDTWTSLRSAVLEHQADIGIALDGDADRCLAVDGDGKVVDGDQSSRSWLSRYGTPAGSKTTPWWPP